MVANCIKGPLCLTFASVCFVFVQRGNSSVWFVIMSEEHDEENLPASTTTRLHPLAHIFAQEWNEEDLYAEVASRNIFIDLPQPLHTTPPKLPSIDPYTVLLNEKQRYVNDVKRCAKYAKNSKINIADINVHTAKYVALPKNAWRLACNIKDPDPFFDGDYNWYYTNGVLDSFKTADSSTKYLIRPYESDSVMITNPHDVDENYLINNQGETIYGLKSDFGSNKYFVTLRKKNFVELLIFDDVEEIALKPAWSVSSKNTPFISAKIDLHTFSDVAVLNLDHTLKVYDIETNREKLTESFSGSSKDNFGQIDLGDNGIVFINRVHLQVFDQRSSIVTHKIKLGDCDYLSTFTVFGGNIYVASKHHVFQLDERNFGVLNKTFHLMNGCPFIVKPIENEGELFMALANDKDRVVVNMSDGLPKEVPNLTDTFIKSQLRGNVYLNKNVEDIFSCSITGMFCDDNVIYTCNSRGDLFEQKFSFCEEPKKDDTDKFDSWIKSIPECETKRLYHTGFVDMSRAKFALCSPYDKEIIGKMQSDVKFKPDFVSYEEGTYARDMEVVWLDEEDELEDLTTPVPEVTSVKKVSEWLTSYTT